MIESKKVNDKELRKLNKMVDQILDKEKEFSKYSVEELKGKTVYFQDLLKLGKTLDDLLIEVFACVREVIYRIFEKKLYRVQLIGGIVVHQGRIAEMKTGEGKTLTEICPAYLNALNKDGVHIVTVNDYLAERDMKEMKEVFEFLGLSVGIIKENSNRIERKEAYNKDVTYTTNTEIGFDYLKDHMIFNREEVVQRKLNFIILDEADSILIDEARTPLIISSEGNSVNEIFINVDNFVKQLNDDDFEKDEEKNSIGLTESGEIKSEKYFNISSLVDIENSNLRHHINMALQAHYMMKLDKNYIVKDGEILIIDEFTGRIAEGRRYSNGLHQALEAKENVEIKADSEALATITYQNLFKNYKKVAGMSGTCKTEENELREVYGLDVVVIPTNKEIQRKDAEDKIYLTYEQKIKALVADVKSSSINGRPILVCTQSIKKSEELSKEFLKFGINHKLLNAKYVKEEAEIIAKAGTLGMITIATNMAGRGTDIKISKEIETLGGLKVISAERAYNRRVDNQLIGRAGRQGQAGGSQFYMSLEDELFTIYGEKGFLKKINPKMILEDGQIMGNSIKKFVLKTQKKVEGIHYDQRRDVIKFDDIVNEQRKVIYSQRQSIVDGINLDKYIEGMIEETLENEIKQIFKQNNMNFESFEDDEEMKSIFCENLLDLLSSEYVGLDEKYLNYYELESKANVHELLEFLKTNLCKIIKERESDAEIEHIKKLSMLPLIDFLWIKHIDNMNALRKNVIMASYKQQDPFQVYKLEGGKLFEKLIENIRVGYVKQLFNKTIKTKCVYNQID